MADEHTEHENDEKVESKAESKAESKPEPPPAPESKHEPDTDILHEIKDAITALSDKLDGLAAPVLPDDGPGDDNGPEHTPWTHKRIF